MRFLFSSLGKKIQVAVLCEPDKIEEAKKFGLIDSVVEKRK